MNKIFKKQYIFLSIIFITLLIIPIILGVVCCENGFTYSWLTNSPTDSMSYMSKINNGKYFDSLEYVVRSNHQTEDLRGGYLFTLYTLFGLIFGNLGMSAGAIFNLMKVLCSIFYLIATYFFIKEFIKEEKRYFTAILLLFTTSITNLIIYVKAMLNIVQTGTQYLPADIYSFESALAAPHFITSIGLIILSCICVNRYNKNKWKYSAINGFILLGIATIHPQVAVFIGLIEGIYLLTEIKSRSYKLRDLLPVSLWGIIPLPYLIYNLYIINNYYSLQVWISKNVHPYHPGTLVYFFLPSFILLLYLLWKKRNIIKENKLFFIWGICILITTLLPGKFQVKMTEGASIPMLMLLSNLLLSFNLKKLTTIAHIGLILILAPIITTTIIPNYHDVLIYEPEYYSELYQDVDKLEYPSVILSNALTSSFIHANTKQVLPIAAHPDESLKYEEYSALCSQGLANKDFSFLEKLTEIDYYIYDENISKNYESSEIERNLPYKKIKETENYIIYDLREPLKGEK